MYIESETESILFEYRFLGINFADDVSQLSTNVDLCSFFLNVSPFETFPLIKDAHVHTAQHTLGQRKHTLSSFNIYESVFNQNEIRFLAQSESVDTRTHTVSQTHSH